LASDNRFLKRARLEFAYFGGYARLTQRKAAGAGVVLRFERVRERQHRRFQPFEANEITPQFLDRLIRALKRWKYDIVSIDEVCRRAMTLPTARRFVCLTFDGGYKDLITSAYPVLSRHGVPFTIYLPTAFPDGVGGAWWLALEEMIARVSRIRLVIDGKQRHFTTHSAPEKYLAYEFLVSWSRTLAPPDLTFTINDLCKRYAVDLAGLSRSVSMDWEDLAKLAADPNVTIGSATVNYPVLSSLKDADAQREMAMGKAVAEAAFHRDVRHIAYPFGDRDAWRKQHVAMAEELGFASAATTVPGVVEAKGYTNLRALPRVAWDGRQRSLRMMRVILTGAFFAR
jgi:peptidoglycan/xylan/chitin deacetylase (PgdA/CDA1 family)